MDKKNQIKYVKIASASQILLGAFLALEHILFRKYIDNPGLFEHEWIGWILISTGMLTGMLNLPHKQELDQKYYLKDE
jgi:hypothetical protein